MKKNKSKKLILKIILVFLSLNIGVLSVKPTNDQNKKNLDTSKPRTYTTNSKLTGKHSHSKKSNYHSAQHNRLPYLNEPTIEETQRNFKRTSHYNTTCHQKTKIIYFYENEKFKLIEIMTESGIIISRKIPKKPKNSTPLNKIIKKTDPVYGPYKNDPYGESDEEWDNNSYVDDSPYLININNLFSFFKPMVINNINEPDTPKNHKYYAISLTFSHNFYHNYPFAEYLIRVLDTDCLKNYLEKMEKEISSIQPYKKDSEKINLNMFIMDNRIKLSKPLDFSKDVWSKRQKNLNYIIYVKKEFLQKLTPEEWDKIIFYIPFKISNLII